MIYYFDMALKITSKEKEAGVFVVSPAGSIDTENAPEFEQVLKKFSQAKAIILDMNKVTYITSMGLSVIFKTKQLLEQRKSVLLITNLPARVQKVFELVKVIPEYVFATMEQADTYLDTFLANVEKDDTA